MTVVELAEMMKVMEVRGGGRGGGHRGDSVEMVVKIGMGWVVIAEMMMTTVTVEAVLVDGGGHGRGGDAGRDDGEAGVVTAAAFTVTVILLS